MSKENGGPALLDSFSGSVTDLKRGNRTIMDFLAALNNDPMVSTWDMSEYKWVRDGVYSLKDNGLIVELNQPYPWPKYALTKAGRELLAERSKP
jgi:hypothetical protein